MDDLLFGSIDIPILDKLKAAEAVLKIPESYSWWDDYRATKMIPLMSKNGNATTNYTTGDFLWTPCAPKIIIEWFEDIVFDWLGSKSRIMVLITEPQNSNREHIDCEPYELNTRQHKFRIVLQGQTNSLYFKTVKGDISAPEVNGPFLMDGGWPHGMKNSIDERKVTLALGAPWHGKDCYNDVSILMKRSDHQMPEVLDDFWKQR